MKRKTAVITITGILVGGAAAWAMGPRHDHAGHLGHGDGPHGPLRTLIHGEMGRLAALHSDLGVTEEQREQIHAVVESYRGEFAPLIRDVAQSRRALHEAVVASSEEDDDIVRAAGTLGDSIAAVALLAADVVREIRPLLTAEQVEQLETFRAERHAAVDRWFDAHHESVEETE